MSVLRLLHQCLSLVREFYFITFSLSFETVSMLDLIFDNIKEILDIIQYSAR